ncbi:recombinase family protein [Alteromonas gilva]|uniref:Recombinase family protein n=1 Tax=Alteromonas gilva TaxID=2987522 RepID=A0ABT5KYK7_9ALTE|nr:recombinase family protein [Alteromonas gilva]MDC8829727.1 recombinase family protein [Alteromonas gilva]
MALIGFARVSTREQDLSYQLKALKEAGCSKIFHGKQSGASRENEAKLSELVNYIRDGDIVLVTKLDRLGRSLKSILKTIDAIHSENASLKTLDGAIDTSNESPFAKAQLSLIGTFSQLERDLIVSRTSEGRERAKSEGVRFGRPSKLDEKTKSEIKKLFNNGYGMSKNLLSKKFGVSRMTIGRIVSS